MKQPWLKILIAAGAAGALTAVADWRLAPLVFALVVVTFSPLARRKRLWFVGDVESEYSIVARRREEALRALKDLEDDKLAGKLPADDFERLRPAYLQTAKELTAQLDQIQEKRAAARRRIDEDLARSKAQQ
ncbi:MAG: hypothetical protein H6841_02175 [Planctomycetes bacterium]|nr:hypothetical protein [Planctomycetota bacterium]MCB9935133.1 hypothetical protein [Planctomycetota bacterium]